MDVAGTSTAAGCYIIIIIILYAYLYCTALWCEFQEYALYKNQD